LPFIFPPYTIPYKSALVFLVAIATPETAEKPGTFEPLFAEPEEPEPPRD
jgi:hypothetical protein